MPLAMKVTVSKNLQDKIDRLRDLVPGLDNRISQIVRDSAFSVVAGAKDLVPISTGALRRSIVVDFFDGGLAAVVGSYLPYSARQEFDITLDHSVRQARTRIRNTKSGKPGSVIKGTAQTNPNATWGFIRKGLAQEKDNFLGNLQALVDQFGDAWAS